MRATDLHNDFSEAFAIAPELVPDNAQQVQLEVLLHCSTKAVTPRPFVARVDAWFAKQAVGQLNVRGGPDERASAGAIKIAPSATGFLPFGAGITYTLATPVGFPANDGCFVRVSLVGCK
eukprot:m.366082 g.366082  ORF g.366082 m.366082 type:complete len:120 (-) comp34552_c0_seq1:125-484(-)